MFWSGTWSTNTACLIGKAREGAGINGGCRQLQHPAARPELQTAPPTRTGRHGAAQVKPSKATAGAGAEACSVVHGSTKCSSAHLLQPTLPKQLNHAPDDGAAHGGAHLHNTRRGAVGPSAHAACRGQDLLRGGTPKLLAATWRWFAVRDGGAPPACRRGARSRPAGGPRLSPGGTLLSSSKPFRVELGLTTVTPVKSR